MSEEVVDQITPLGQKIIRQVEYYFGDVNLPKDKFLKEKQVEDDGWVTLECLTTFNKLKELSTDLAEICNALKKSTSGLLEINEDDLKVRRSKDKPLPNLDDPLVVKAKKMKTLYMKGFPTTYTMDQVSEFLRGKDAEPVFVKMRKTDDFKFKGSIFTELETQEQADKLTEDKELKVTEDGEPLIIMKRDDYFDKKSLERKKEKDEAAGEDDSGIKLERKSGAIMHFKNVPEGLAREDVKGLFQPHQNVAWIDFNRGDTQGHIRFEDAGAGQTAIDAAKTAGTDGKIMLKENELEVKVLEGEEEENYYKMTEEEMNRRRSKPKTNFRHGGGRGRGGRGGRGGKRSNDRYGKRQRPWERNNRNGDETESAPTTGGDEKKGDHVRFDNDNDTKAAEAKKTKAEE